VKAKLKSISASCSLILFTLAAVLPQTILAQTNYDWSTPVGSLLDSGSPQGVAVDKAGNVYIADSQNNVILKAALSGTNWSVAIIAGTNGVQGTSNGTNSAARFDNPGGVAVDNAGNLYVADSANNCIRKVTPSGTNWVVTTIAGVANSFGGSTDGTNGAAKFAFPQGIAVDAAGNLFIGDENNNTIRKIRHSGTNWITTTIAGTAGTAGYLDGTNSVAQFADPFGVAVDTADNVYVADANNNAIRKVTPSGTNWIVTTIGGFSSAINGRGSADGFTNASQFAFPVGVAVDAGDNVYVADEYNSTIRKIIPTGRDWNTVTIGGMGQSYGNADGTNVVAAFGLPSGVAVNAFGNVFATDSGNNNLRLGCIFPPLLQLALVTNQITLFYPSALGTNFNFILQSTTNLAGNGWITVTNIGSSSPVQWQLDSNGTPYIKLTLTNKVPDKFFRLEMLQ
jgi:sugar lactone lactonase YvrE